VRNLKLILTVTAAAGIAAAQAVSSGGVINAASFAVGQPVAPGGLVAIFGTNLATSTVAGDTIPLSAAIAGTSVTFNGISAPLLFVSGGQVNAQLPWDVLPAGQTSGTVNVVVNNNGNMSPAMQVQVGALSPGIFSIPNGAGYAVAVNNADGSVAAPVGAIPGIVTHPAKVGDALILYSNGLGAVDNAVANGAASADKLRTALTTPTVLVNGVQAQVFFAGLTPQFPGVNQINFMVPQVNPGDSLPLQLREGGITTTDKVVISVSK
jgi:uncharacterized protein (TIGR03437 family)